MSKLTRMILIAAGAAGLAVGAFGVASAAVSATDQHDDSSDSDVGGTLTEAEAQEAEAAALDHLGEGSVVETEVGDDGAAFEVEVRLDDGRQVEVNLDADFNVTGTEDDDD